MRARCEAVGRCVPGLQVVRLALPYTGRSGSNALALGSCGHGAYSGGTAASTYEGAQALCHEHARSAVVRVSTAALLVHSNAFSLDHLQEDSCVAQRLPELEERLLATLLMTLLANSYATLHILVGQPPCL